MRMAKSFAKNIYFIKIIYTLKNWRKCFVIVQRNVKRTTSKVFTTKNIRCHFKPHVNNKLLISGLVI